MKYTASQYWQHRLIPRVICLRVYGKAQAFILDRHALIETQRAAGQGAGFNGLAIGRGGGIPHALTRFSCGAVINILIGIGVLQHCLPVVEADDAVWRVGVLTSAWRLMLQPASSRIVPATKTLFMVRSE